MILVHKQQYPSSSPYAHHRRHPSAPPTVVVQPTKVPGLLSLSKPVQRQQPQHSRQRPSPKSKQAQVIPLPRATPASQVTPTLKPSSEITDDKSSSANSRGRQQLKPQQKQTARNNSHSAVRGRRNNARQQSPPIPTSQVEVPSSPTYLSNNSNPFDPFLDDSDPRSKFIRPASIPTLASRPSGKLARRRNKIAPSSATTKAIPVPRNFSSSTPNLSRSEPSASNVRTLKVNPVFKDGVFPICDDLTDSEYDSGDDSTPPATPTRSRAPRFTLGLGNGPRTAPITASASTFPFVVSSTPSPVGKRSIRTHSRVPSEGVFAMSSDEEPSTYRVAGRHDIDLKALLGLAAQRLPLSEESDQEREAAAAAAAAAYFASSNFQNSPSPDELPPPSFAFV
ncbi:hypothetical protein DFH05DRAFT_979652 [Lentinula detonsa]|uniref:Uncharacterized protein n=1 Tax=Lentinula detonsa TaxID=2804962 RepID=A0A9W8P4F5_9AGAR|nr:hypothetical protein DFH05DRAFT_979652 [Lentinula detonsa]